MPEKVDFIWKLLIALCGGIFSVAIAISVQKIKLIGLPRMLVVLAIIVQLALSFGVFIFVMMFFKSGFLPESMPNDDWSALSAAYFLSAIPHIVVATAILIYNKEINKWLEQRYGKENVPSMENSQKEIESIEQDFTQSAQPQESPKECESLQNCPYLAEKK